MSNPDTRFSDAKEQVRQATDIVELVGKHLELRRAGRGYVGRCPWHDDRRPSLQVNPDRQTWKCWVCDIGGDVFSFVMKREGCDFREALQMLADRAGIPLAAGSQKKAAPGSPDDKNTLYQCCDWAAKQFHEFLLSSDGAAAARQYLDERGITSESIRRFQIGYAPDNWTWLIDRSRNTPFSQQVLQAAGLVGQSDRGGFYDRFKGRVIFPIHNLDSKPIAFGGRILPGNKDENAAKYVNSPETRLFSKSENLYALNQARNHITKTRRITVVEGYTDVVLCHQSGAKDVVAVLGTALGMQHVKVLKRFADTIFLVLDGDDAGKRRANEVLSLFVMSQVDLKVATLPDDLDPAEFVLERGGQSFQEAVLGALDALGHKMKVATEGIDIGRETHRANQAMEDVLATIAGGLKTDITDVSALRHKQFAASVAKFFMVDVNDVQDRLAELRRTTKRWDSNELTQESTSQVFRFADLPSTESELLELLVLHPELAPIALTEISDDDLTSSTARELFRTYRRLEERGLSVDFNSVMSEIENPQLKHVLAQLDELSQKKSCKANIDGTTRLRSVIRQFHKRHELREIRQRQTVFEQRLLTEEEETKALFEDFAAKRRQQGITAPTDG